MRRSLLYMIVVLLALRTEAQQTGPDSTRPIDVAKRIAAITMRAWPYSGDLRPAPSPYDDGVLWVGLMRLWYNTGDAVYYDYVKHRVDRLLTDRRFLNSPRRDRWDTMFSARSLLQLYEVTENPGYYRAAARLRRRSQPQPATAALGQPEVIVNSYLVDPFQAHYAALFHEDSLLAEIAREFAEMEPFTVDRKTGLPRGGSAGWYGMGLVDALDYFPAGNPGREVLMGILQRYAAAASKSQDKATGLWLDPPNYPHQAGDDSAAIVSAGFVYMFARAVRKGYLPSFYRGTAVRGWAAIPGRAVHTDLEETGAIMLAAIEMDELYSSYGKGDKTVLLDYYFNNERRKDITGAQVRYHYTWEDRANSGFSLLGHLFRQYGARTDSLPVAPTADNLRNASIYIIVDPDDDREVPHPNYPGPADIRAIDDWVRAGGVLVLMSNDSANAEFPHFNVLAGTFGIHFNVDDYHKVAGNHFEMGAFDLPPNDAIFRSGHRIYIKEMSTLRLEPPAKAHFTDGGHAIMAVAKVGRGTVFAIGDPWFYNEYTDGRKLPPAYENYNAARDLVQWLLAQSH